MERITIFGDLHGNLPALKAVLADIEDLSGAVLFPYHRILPSGRQVVNAGSVGKPKDGNSQACYVVLESMENSLRVVFKRVAYDVERTAQAIEASEMPNEYAQMLRTGTG